MAAALTELKGAREAAYERKKKLAEKPPPPPAKPEPVPAKPEPVPVKPEPPVVKPEPPVVKPEPPAVKPEPPAVAAGPGILEIVTTPAEANVFVDDKRVEKKTVSVDSSVNHKVRVECPGYQPHEQSYRVKPGQKRSLEILLQKETKKGFFGK